MRKGKLIKCPHCGEEFPLTRNEYDSILKQVRDQTFQQELDAYKKAIDAEKQTAIQEATQSEKLRAQEELRASVRRGEAVESQLRSKIHELEDRIHHDELTHRDSLHEAESKYRKALSDKDAQIEQLRDFRSRLSTKMVGESLEMHCQAEFEKIRSLGFPNAVFEKDNDIRQGSKGDYIFRETDNAGNEIISIMFEMKNQTDSASVKKKNEDFFKELDKDRRQKKCEYAVLVSLLEPENDFYNSGIADVTYKYPKMYVIRPQCFIPMITILRNAALNTMGYKRELAKVKERNIDMALFEQEFENFKYKFGTNFRYASDKFSKAIDDIDKSIAVMQRVKEELIASGKYLEIANKKAQELTVEKLTIKASTAKKSSHSRSKSTTSKSAAKQNTPKKTSSKKKL